MRVRICKYPGEEDYRLEIIVSEDDSQAFCVALSGEELAGIRDAITKTVGEEKRIITLQ
jgi:hypothetical protein